MEVDDRERVAFRVTGRVQGVGYRMWARRVAIELGLRGAVRNRYDGTVEVNVEGPSASVALMERRLSHGPRGAYVTGVERDESDLPIPESGFDIEASS